MKIMRAFPGIQARTEEESLSGNSQRESPTNENLSCN